MISSTLDGLRDDRTTKLGQASVVKGRGPKGALSMAGTDTAIFRLSELADGQEAEVFAALVKRDTTTDKNGNPYYKCLFRDK
jgi:hypothetical protein